MERKRRGRRKRKMKKKWWIVVKSKTFNGSIGRCMCLRAQAIHQHKKDENEDAEQEAWKETCEEGENRK